MYAPVKIQTDKHIYEGQIILAPSDEFKAHKEIWDIFGTTITIKSSAASYVLQTRGYQIYSDFGDERLTPYLYERFGVDVGLGTLGTSALGIIRPAMPVGIAYMAMPLYCSLIRRT